ncbi:glycoside hydrolase family 3 C-terminal domain-containing protein [Catenovulum sp. 2E275]|uniref:glycoside hydrolase family 3 protein n=1 Tax=Catenovulum sp. 2E275 TaxID=2980497 RepID=UPI0021D0358F|nr:glycoside hydrolase family 3 N-terminal domain-containing protein [Catenovulum sp. 2E275]MCU4677114.1 glycoside hydrolase family 3 C-terminal domain-containing protein [Catenovulum sp. 2E275]
MLNQSFKLSVLSLPIVLAACSEQTHQPQIPDVTKVTKQNSQTQAQAETIHWPNANTRLKRDPAVEQKVAEILANMTLEQKVAQMVQPEIGYLTVEQMRKYGFGSYLNGGNTAPYGNKTATPQEWLKYADEMYEASIDDSLDGVKIPTIWGTDAMHGHSNVSGTTLFPHNIGLGAMNNPELIRKIGEATAKEVAITGIEWSFAPTVAVVQDDRWGRTYESYSENPEIVAAYAKEMVAGLQGEIGKNFLTGYHRIATAKHFVGDGGTVNGIDRGDTLASEQEMRDIHAAGYFTAIEAGVQSVMASFNSWKGERLHGHKYLLTDVLKGQMGFDGFVVSDWNGHKFVDGCDLEQCANAINAGIDVIMVPEHFEAFYHNTIAQVKSGEIPMSRIDDAVTRFLRAKVRWGLFERGKPSEREMSNDLTQFGATAHREIARQAVRESLVLLKNNQQLLPLNPKANILIAGDAADSMAKQAGGWSVSWQGTDNTNADFPGATTIYQGLKTAIETAGGSVQYSVDGEYSSKPDVAIVVIGEDPYAEWFGDIQYIEYQKEEKTDLALLKKLKAQGIPVVTVFISGRPLWVNKEINASDAFVAAWLPGSEGQGVADVLLTQTNGQVNFDFKGKLSFSWPKYDTQVVLNSRDENYDPLFAYGFGLTYQDKVELAELDETVRVKEQKATDVGYALFYRQLGQGLNWSLGDKNDWSLIIEGPSGTTKNSENLTIQAINLAYQEDARKFVWSGQSEAAAQLIYSKPKNMAEIVNQQSVVNFELRVDTLPTEKVSLALFCTQNCQPQVDITDLLKQQTTGEWIKVSVDVSCLADKAELQAVTIPWQIKTTGQLGLAVSNLAIQNKDDDQVSLSLCQ